MREQAVREQQVQGSWGKIVRKMTAEHQAGQSVCSRMSKREGIRTGGRVVTDHDPSAVI